MPAFQKEKKNEKAGKGSIECHSKGLAEDQAVFQQSFCQALHPTFVQLREIKTRSNKYIDDKVTKYKYKFNFFFSKIYHKTKSIL